MFKKAVFTIIILAGLGFSGCSSKAQNTGETPEELNSTQTLSGTITGVEQGKDGFQVTLETEDGAVSVTISVIRAEVFGRMDQIKEGSEIEVSGMVLEGMDPPLIAAEQVRVLGSEPDYVMNLKGEVTQIELGKDGITATVKTSDGTEFQVVISMVTTEIVYPEPKEEIQEGTVLLISGDLLDLDGAHIAADRVVVNPGASINSK